MKFEVQSSCGHIFRVCELNSTHLVELQKFNDSLSECTRKKFMPHGYTDSILTKALKRAEYKHDLLLAIFEEVMVAVEDWK